jgi:hypothetical protein
MDVNSLSHKCLRRTNLITWIAGHEKKGEINFIFVFG